MYLEYMITQMTKCIHTRTETKQENSFQILSKGQTENTQEIKQIFLVPDNISIHIFKKKDGGNNTKTLSKQESLYFYQRHSPELNLIEVRWMWMQRQMINNSTFEDECDIGKSVTDWTKNYNKKHGRAIRKIYKK